MTPSDLIDDLKSRINPAYANQIGTESYERRLCVEALEALVVERDELLAAARKVLIHCDRESSVELEAVIAKVGAGKTAC